MKIDWCKKQDNGIKLVTPNANISSEYFRSAEESLLVLRKIISTDSSMWIATTKYYIEYFALYAILMKLGVKCEIHDCSIALAEFLERQDVIPRGTHALLEDDKRLRIDNQYYLRNKKVDIDFDQLAQYLEAFRRASDSLDEETITTLRKKIRKL